MKAWIGKILYGIGYASFLVYFALSIAELLILLPGTSYLVVIAAIGIIGVGWILLKEVGRRNEKKRVGWPEYGMILIGLFGAPVTFWAGMFFMVGLMERLSDMILPILLGIYLITVILWLLRRSRRRFFMQAMGLSFLIFAGTLAGVLRYDQYEESQRKCKTADSMDFIGRGADDYPGNRVCSDPVTISIIKQNR